MADQIEVSGVTKTRYGYIVDNFHVYKNDPMWSHCKDRVGSWNAKFTREEFIKKNMTRLKRISKKEKLYYTLAVLIDMGFDQEVIDMYDARIVMDALTDDLDFLKDI